jgi:broad specificity phosphatase PhoE
MTKRKIHLIRHAESSANVAGIVCGSLDYPLTDFGRQHALTCSQAPLFHAISSLPCFTSDLIRATETAKLLGFSKVTPLAGLRETNTGRSSTLKISEFQIDYPQFNHHETNLDERYQDGETTREMIFRSWATFKHTIEPQLEVSNEIVIVAHGGPLNAIAGKLLKAEFDAFPMFLFKNLSIMTLINPTQINTQWVMDHFHAN